MVVGGSEGKLLSLEPPLGLKVVPCLGKEPGLEKNWPGTSRAVTKTNTKGSTSLLPLAFLTAPSTVALTKRRENRLWKLHSHAASTPNQLRPSRDSLKLSSHVFLKHVCAVLVCWLTHVLCSHAWGWPLTPRVCLISLLSCQGAPNLSIIRFPGQVTLGHVSLWMFNVQVFFWLHLFRSCFCVLCYYFKIAARGPNTFQLWNYGPDGVVSSLLTSGALRESGWHRF